MVEIQSRGNVRPGDHPGANHRSGLRRTRRRLHSQIRASRPLFRLSPVARSSAPSHAANTCAGEGARHRRDRELIRPREGQVPPAGGRIPQAVAACTSQSSSCRFAFQEFLWTRAAPGGGMASHAPCNPYRPSVKYEPVTVAPPTMPSFPI